MSAGLVEILGSLACFFTFVMYTSTIDQIRTVLKTKRSDEVSIILYIMMFFNCFFWAMYGLFITNYYILVPNSLGCLLSATTTIIIWKYR